MAHPDQISFVGPPGCGKSTLINALAPHFANPRLMLEEPDSYPFVRFVAEPSPAWQTLNQCDFMLRKVAAVLSDDPPLTAIRLMESDWYSCHTMWVPTLHRIGLIDSADRDALQQIFSQAVAAGVPVPRLTFWMRAPGELLAQRIVKRDRHFEVSSTFAALVRALAEFEDFPLPGRVVQLNAADSVTALTEAVLRELSLQQNG